MKLNTELYERIVDSAITDERVYTDELATIDENYEDQLRLIETLGVKVKKFREKKSRRIFIQVIEQAPAMTEEPEKAEAPEPAEPKTAGAEAESPGSDKAQSTESLPKSEPPAPASSMSPAESPSVPDESPEQAAAADAEEEADLDKSAFVFRAVGIETSQTKKKSTIKLTPKTDADALVAASFAQKHGDDFVVFLRPAKKEEEEPELKNQAGETISGDEEVPAAAPDEEAIEEIVEPGEKKPKSKKQLAAELEQQTASGELDRESAKAQSSLMKSGGAGPAAAGNGRRAV